MMDVSTGLLYPDVFCSMFIYSYDLVVELSTLIIMAHACFLGLFLEELLRVAKESDNVVITVQD